MITCRGLPLSHNLILPPKADIFVVRVTLFFFSFSTIKKMSIVIDDNQVPKIPDLTLAVNIPISANDKNLFKQYE